MNGERQLKLFAQAVDDFRNALLQVRTREQLSHDWATTQNNLGNVYRNLGTRTGGEEGAKLLAQAVEAYRAALLVYTREHLPQQWAGTKNNLGTALQEQGKRTRREDGTKLLSQAVEAYHAALTVRTSDYLPVGWAETQNHLQYLYHEELFNFSEAFVVNQQLVDRFPNDLSIQCDFAEKHFTTGRFAECEKRIVALLANSEIESRVKVAPRAIQIANSIALGKTKEVPSQLKTLQKTIASQPDTFKVGGTFEGTKHFISIEPKLARYRAWLLQLFAAVENPNGREAILAALREVREKFKAVVGR